MSKLRPVTALPMSRVTPADIGRQQPRLAWVKVAELYIEGTYQRDLSERSRTLIRKIVAGWDWCHIKPLIVAIDENRRMVVVDGQHTAIAAASHGAIEQLPALIVPAAALRQRARAFIGHNTLRLRPTTMQLVLAAAAAEDPVAQAVLVGCKKGGAAIRPNPPQYGHEWEVGETISVVSLRKIAEAKGSAGVARVTRILVAAHRAPLRAAEIKAVAWFLYQAPEKIASDPDIVDLIASKDADEWERAAEEYRSAHDISLWRAIVEIWRQRLEKRRVAA